MLIPGFNWKEPDYAAVYRARLIALQQIRDDVKAKGSMLTELRAFYKEDPASFINDWGVTFDPRLVERGLPGNIPFVLFPKQREWIAWVMRRWRAQKGGISEKTRDWGVSYLAVDLGCTLCLFYNSMSIGYGSRKEEYVDKAGQPKSLFWKGRLFMSNLPDEFRGGWVEWRDAPHMRITFPDTGSVMTGETGDQIGRGDRQAIYFTDEDAFNPAAATIEHSISQTTNCRISISTPRGMNNPFAQKRWAPSDDPDRLFICDWRDDPRKDDEWYRKQKEEHDDVTIAQEIDRDYAASVEGVVIPGAWVRAAIDARDKLGIALSGTFTMALDPADEGDNNAAIGGQGIDVSVIEEWSGKGSDTFASVQKMVTLCDEHEVEEYRYDSDGLGALVRGDMRIINDQRKVAGLPAIRVRAYRGSAEVVEPEAEDVKGRKNKDYFANAKAQNWWALRRRFQLTYRWVVEGKPCNPDEIISISSKAKNHLRLVAELSQPTYKQNGVGKLVIDKKPEGMKSPNMADGVVIKFAKLGPAPIVVSDTLLKLSTMPTRRRRP